MKTALAVRIEIINYMKEPLLSVIITVFNTKPYLKKCFDSVFAQNNDDIEIIIVNDGSTDDSLVFCEKYSEQYDNVIIVNKKNGGASDARNAGLLKAKGKFIHFIDSDDFIIMSNLYVNVCKIINNHNPDIIFSLYKGYDKETFVEKERQRFYCFDGFYSGNILLDILKNQYQMTLTCPVNKIFKREFLINNNLFFVVELDHEEDEWLPRVISCANTCYFFNKYIYGVRCSREGSLSENKNDQVKARKARSKMIIASIGMDYMKAKSLSKDTLRYVAGYYWGYMMSAVINTYNLKDKTLKNTNFAFIKKHKRFFDNYKLLLNKNWQIMGWLFKHLGIRFTAFFLAKRYEKR